MKAKPVRHCAFCARTADEVELLFRSEHGGLPPLVCDRCVMTFAIAVETHRNAPALLPALIEMHNGEVMKSRRGAR